MNRTILIIFAVLLLTSCRKDFDFEKAKTNIVLKGKGKEFAQAFEDLFGAPSNKCTWTMVKQASATLRLDGNEGNCDIKVMTADPRINSEKCFLLATYKNVSTSQPLEFDYPVGLNSVFVSATAKDGTYTGMADVEDLANQKEIVLKKDDTFTMSEVKKMHYTLLFEAFTGGTLDFDYNDVVLDLEYARGEESMNVTLRAVGNSYNTRIAYQREKQDEDIFTEAHKALGYPVMYNYATEENIFYILNTGVNNSGRKATATVTLGSDKDKSICEVAANIIAYIMENDKKEDVVVKYALSSTPGQPNPEALLLSIPDWNYSREEMPIHVMYYDFLYWIKDPESNPYWSGYYWAI